MNRAIKSPERLTPEQRGEQLIAELDAMAATPRPDEYRILRLKAKIGGLGMVQPFSWIQWQEPYPEPEQTRMLDLETAIRHITRICRAERFFENSIVGHIRSGLLMGLCLVVREHTQRQLDLFIELVNGEFGPSTGMTFVQSTSDPRDVGR